jgi:hypothetical protein
MPRYSAEQIYAFAVEAGFSPDQATTMTAVALAESGGNGSALNTTPPEHSIGLWQINANAHPDLASRFNLNDPVDNARAAYLVSHNGTDVSPWTTTHNGLGARYLRFRDQAQAAAYAHGDGNQLGVWTGTSGYGHPLSPGTGSGRAASLSGESGDSNVVSHSTPMGGGTPTGGGQAHPEHGEAYGIAFDRTPGHDGHEYGIAFDPTAVDVPGGVQLTGAEYGITDTPAGGDGAASVLVSNTTPADGTRADAFVDAALRQAGDRYIYGVETHLNDPNPKAFDCSELVQWAAHQAGVEVQDGAVYQYREMRDHGSLMPVDQALHTKGALLFYFNTDPNSTDPPHAHVAISLGDGRTIEARGHAYGVGSWEASDKRFNYAAYIPGLGAAAGPAPVLTSSTDPVVVAFDPNDPTAADPTGDFPDDGGWQFGVDPDSLDAGPDSSGAEGPVLVSFNAVPPPVDPPPPPGAALVSTHPAAVTDAAALHPVGADPLAVQLGTFDLDGDGLDDSLEQAVGWGPPPPAATGPVDHHGGWDHDGHDHVAH